jgi:hypothetical protein
MSTIAWLPVSALAFCVSGFGQDAAGPGAALAERQALHNQVRNSPRDAAAALRYATFLDRYRDPDARATYERALGLLEGDAHREERMRVTRRLVALDLLEGERDAAAKRLAVYRSAGGVDLPAGLPAPAPNEQTHTILIPGPLSSFARMAAVWPEGDPGEILASLARNVITNGYEASAGGEALEPTEYMKLLTRYLSQARELEKLAGAENAIRVQACESEQTGELLRVLGYRMRGGCGGELALETVNASRAFLTIDSGFPIAELEQALRTNRPFTYSYRPTSLPVLYGADYWMTPKNKESGAFIDAFLADPMLCRLYLGLWKLDPETAEALRSQVPMARLRVFAHVLDFFGGMFAIRGGQAVVPGGARCAAMWGELAGVPPAQGAAFFERLIAKDDGWMASYFDALARANGAVQEYLTEPQRMKRFYLAIRGRVTSPGPARPVFRSNSDMMLLTTRLRLEPDGRPHIPGDIEVWKGVFTQRARTGRYDGKLARTAVSWKDGDDVLEALFGLCRKSMENEPLKIFMALSDLDRVRTRRLEPATAARLARGYHEMAAQFPVFAETPGLRDATILQFLDVADRLTRISDTLLRFDAIGTVQGLAGMWQIFCRQGSIAPDGADPALAAILTPFASVRNNRELFDAGRSGVVALLKATDSPENANPQERLVDLLAGAPDSYDAGSHDRVVQEMIRIFEAQRLISLDLLFQIADNLEGRGRGQTLNLAPINRLTSRLSEVQAARASLSSAEKNALSFGYWAERHIELERKLNLKALAERAGTDPLKAAEVRGALAPLLRDTLAGFNYMHYAPPAAQLLLTNPVFVRSHDFQGVTGSRAMWSYADVVGSGWPSSAGGRLVGSLAGLPYVLAEAEQNFMVPAREQALIWSDLVPQVILSAKVPRWWNVTPLQLHWIGLHMRYAESLLAESALDARRREQVVEALSLQAGPGRVRRVQDLLAQGEVRQALEQITPAEMFAVAGRILAQDPASSLFPAPELRQIASQFPDAVAGRTISRVFGTPKPTLTSSYRPELLHLRTFPTLMGYSSRILAESWESTLLYWASIADEAHVSPPELNVLIPEWTQKAVERIFASNLEDWPALLRSMRQVGEDVRLRLRVQMDSDQKASLGSLN